MTSSMKKLLAAKKAELEQQNRVVQANLRQAFLTVYKKEPQAAIEEFIKNTITEAQQIEALRAQSSG